eukprot:209678-Pelagomonas_calceolata.AAC.3
MLGPFFAVIRQVCNPWSPSSQCRPAIAIRARHLSKAALLKSPSPSEPANSVRLPISRAHCHQSLPPE